MILLYAPDPDDLDEALLRSSSGAGSFFLQNGPLFPLNGPLFLLFGGQLPAIPSPATILVPIATVLTPAAELRRPPPWPPPATLAATATLAAAATLAATTTLAAANLRRAFRFRRDRLGRVPGHRRVHLADRRAPAPPARPGFIWFCSGSPAFVIAVDEALHLRFLSIGEFQFLLDRRVHGQAQD